MVAGVAGVYVVSKTIYGLRSAVEKAVQLEQYVVHEKIGEAGMGAVYRASHAMLKRPTAITLIPPDRAGETATARFEREVMATSRLTHPNNVALYDFGRTRGGVFYYAMELLDGEDLPRLLERVGPQSVERTRHILRQVAAALGEAHAAGLVHRDVKPPNIMLCTRGGVRDFVKVLDFGLAEDAATPADVKITSERTIAGGRSTWRRSRSARRKPWAPPRTSTRRLRRVLPSQRANSIRRRQPGRSLRRPLARLPPGRRRSTSPRFRGVRRARAALPREEAGGSTHGA